MSNVIPFRAVSSRSRSGAPASDTEAVERPSTGPDRSGAEPLSPEPLWRESVGRVLRAERTRRGARIADVAERAGVAPQYLSEIERGRKDPSSEVLSATTGALDLSLSELATRAARHLASGGPVCLAA